MSQMSLRAYYAKLESDLAANLADSVIQHARYLLGYYPKNRIVHRLLGQALLRLGRSDEAATAFGRTLSIAPDDAPAHLGLSEIADNAHNGDDALYHAERAYEVNVSDTRTSEIMRGLMAHYRPNLPQRLQLTQSALARQALRNGQYRQAIETLRGAVERRPERHDLRLLLAQALWQAGDRVEAAEASLEVLRALPDALEANRIMTQLWLEEDRPSDAQRYLGVIEGVDPYLALELVTGQVADDEAFHIELLDEASASQAAVLAARPDWLQSLPGEQLADQALAEAASAGDSDVNWPAWSSGMLSRASEPAPAATGAPDTGTQADNAADLFAEFDAVSDSGRAESADELDDLPAFGPLSESFSSAASPQDTLLESQLDDAFLAAYESSSSTAVVPSSGSAADSDSFAFDFAPDVQAQPDADEADWMQEYAGLGSTDSTDGIAEAQASLPGSGMLFSPTDDVDEAETFADTLPDAVDQSSPKPTLNPQVRPTGALAGEAVASDEELDALNTYAELFDAPANFAESRAPEKSNADGDPLAWLRGSDIEIDESDERVSSSSALQRDFLDESLVEMDYSDPTSVDPTGWLAGYDPNYRPVASAPDSAPEAAEAGQAGTSSPAPSPAPAAAVPDLFSDFDEEEPAAPADGDQFSWLQHEREAASIPPPHQAQTDELSPWLAPRDAGADGGEQEDDEKAARASEATRLRPLFGTPAPDALAADLDLLAADLRAEENAAAAENDDEESWLQSVSEETSDAPVPGPRRGLTSMLQDANLSWLQNTPGNTPAEAAPSGLTDDERLNQTLMSDALADAFTDDWMTQFGNETSAEKSDEPDWLSALEPEATDEPDDSELVPNDYADLFELAAPPANAPAEPDEFAASVEPALESWLAEAAPEGMIEPGTVPELTLSEGETPVSEAAQFDWLDLDVAQAEDDPSAERSSATITPLYENVPAPAAEAEPPIRVTAELESWLADAAAPVTGMLTNVEDDGYDTAFTAPDYALSSTPSLSLEPEDESGLDVTELSSRFRAEPLPEIDSIVQSADLPDWLAEVQPAESASAASPSTADLEALFSEENLRRATTGQLNAPGVQFGNVDSPAFGEETLIFGTADETFPADWTLSAPAMPPDDPFGATLPLPSDSDLANSWDAATGQPLSEGEGNRPSDQQETRDTDEWMAALGSSLSTSTTSAPSSPASYGTVMLDEGMSDDNAQTIHLGDSFDDVDWERLGTLDEVANDSDGSETGRSGVASGFQITVPAPADAPRSARDIDPGIDVELGWLDSLPLTDEANVSDDPDALVEPDVPDWLIEASNVMERPSQVTSVDEYETRKFNIASFAASQPYPSAPEAQWDEETDAQMLEAWPEDVPAVDPANQAVPSADFGAWSALADERADGQSTAATADDFAVFPAQDALDTGATGSEAHSFAPNAGIDDFLNEIEADYLPSARPSTGSLRSTASDEMSLLDEIAADYLAPRPSAPDVAPPAADRESTDGTSSSMLYTDTWANSAEFPQNMDADTGAFQDAMDAPPAYPTYPIAEEDAIMTFPPPNATPDSSDRDTWEGQQRQQQQQPQNSAQDGSPENNDALFSFGDDALPDWLKEAAPDLNTTSIGESGVSESGFAFEEAFGAGGNSPADADEFDALFANTNAEPGASGASGESGASGATDDGEDAESWLSSLTTAPLPEADAAAERNPAYPLASEIDSQIDSEMDWLSEEDLGFAFGGDADEPGTPEGSAPRAVASEPPADEFDLDALIASQTDEASSPTAANSFTPPVYDPARSEAVSDTLPVRPDLSWLTDEDPAVAAQVGWAGSLDNADVGDPGTSEPAAQTYSETYADPYADLLSSVPAPAPYSTINDPSVSVDEPDWGAVTQTEEQVAAVPIFAQAASSSEMQTSDDRNEQAAFAPETGEWPMQETWDAALESPVAQAAAPVVPAAAEADSFDLSAPPADAVSLSGAEAAQFTSDEADIVNNPALPLDEDFRIEPLEDTPTAADVAVAEAIRAEAEAEADANLNAISGEPTLAVFPVAEAEPANYLVDSDTAYGETPVAQPDQLVDATPLEVTNSVAAADERFEDDGGDAGYYAYAEPEATDISPAVNAPDWLNAMVPGLDVDTSATQDEPIETEFYGGDDDESIGEPGEGVEGYGWLNEMVDEESQQLSAASRRFSFSRLPAWLTRRGGSQTSTPTAQAAPETVQSVPAIPEDDSDLPEWLR